MSIDDAFEDKDTDPGAFTCTAYQTTELLSGLEEHVPEHAKGEKPELMYSAVSRHDKPQPHDSTSKQNEPLGISPLIMQSLLRPSQVHLSYIFLSILPKHFLAN